MLFRSLIMLVLIGIVPAAYALDMDASPQEIAATAEAARKLEVELERPDLAFMMNALKEQHVATSRVERISRSEGVAAAASLESEMVDLLRVALRAVDAPGEQYERLGLAP